MAGGGGAQDASLTGFKKYFNSTTDLGRGTAAKITYAGVALISLYMLLKPKQKPNAAPPQ